MFQCDICHQESKSLVLNVCAKCDPELHRTWNAAVNSSIDDETVTPEMMIAFKVLQDRKLNGHPKIDKEPIGILG